MATVVFFSIHDLEKYSDLRNFSCHVTDMFKFDDIVILANKTSKMLKNKIAKIISNHVSMSPSFLYQDVS